MKSIYQLNLHEMVVVEDSNLFTTAFRVPGGWIYRSYDKSAQIMGSVFVPFDNEFQTVRDTIK